jgi:carbon-monoxide dehydrogenase catalytic subunit
MTGANQLVELLTEKTEDVIGEKIALGDDPVEVAKNIEAHILGKRNALGLS